MTTTTSPDTLRHALPSVTGAHYRPSEDRYCCHKLCSGTTDDHAPDCDRVSSLLMANPLGDAGDD